MSESTEAADFSEEKSKSQIKREMLALQDLGLRLTELKPDVLQQMPLNDALKKAIDESKKHTSHIARKRHTQYLGKLLRGHDIESIQKIIDLGDSSTREYNDRFHALERWRARLIDEGDAALQDFMQAYPQTDSQHLRGLIRTARQELEREKPPAASRKIFRYIRELEEARLFGK